MGSFTNFFNGSRTVSRFESAVKNLKKQVKDIGGSIKLAECLAAETGLFLIVLTDMQLFRSAASSRVSVVSELCSSLYNMHPDYFDEYYVESVQEIYASRAVIFNNALSGEYTPAGRWCAGAFNGGDVEAFSRSLYYLLGDYAFYAQSWGYGTVEAPEDVLTQLLSAVEVFQFSKVFLSTVPDTVNKYAEYIARL